MVKKINVLYDANLLLNDANKNSGRTGIFFVVYNVLVNLLKYETINVDLYCNVENRIRLAEYLKTDSNLSSAKISDTFNGIESILAKWEYKKYLYEKNQNKGIGYNLTKLVVKFLINLDKLVKLNKKNFKDKISKYDVYFSPFNEPPNFFKKCPEITKYSIIYDTIPFVYPEYYPGIEKKKFWYNKIVNAINKETYYFSISDYTKKDFIKYVPAIDADKITVTLLAASEEFYQCKDESKIEQIKEKYKIPKDSKYIFSLCSLEPRKNLIFAVKNFIEFIKKNNINDMYFVLGGAEWGYFIDALNKTISDLDVYKSKILKAGYVADEDLTPLYSGAFCFIYPSIYEGFGLPPLEAMQCGCPVIASNVTSLPEVIGDAGLMINPDSDKELIKALEKIYYDEKLRVEYSNKGIEWAKEFSWSKTVDIMVNKITEVFNESTNNIS